VSLHFTDDAVAEVARIAALVNSRTQDIGARRLHTILERLLDPVSFEASDAGRSRDEVIDVGVVRTRLRRSSRTRTSPAIFSEHSAMPIPQTVVPGVERQLPSKNRAVMDRARAHLLQNYKQQPIVLERGQGTKVWGRGRQRLPRPPWRHRHLALRPLPPDITAAAKAQMDRLWHASNVFYTEPQVTLAELLTSLSGLDRAFFCNSGAEANEALLKLARKTQHARGQPGRFEFVCFETSFHGRTLATVTATGQTKYQKGFEPLLPGVVHVPYGDLAAVRKAVGPGPRPSSSSRCRVREECATAPEGFLRALRTLADENGVLLLVDEVQTGMGRTGKMFAFQHEGIRPDGFSLARASPTGCPSARWCAPRNRGRRSRPARTEAPSAETRWRLRRPSPRSASPATRASSPPTSRRASTSSPAAGRCRPAIRRW
jgi:hypothetical protein